ncbi:4Fe-4S dicluster domain-containing protein [Consotaella salsifontis]|uniref:4Fe-4S binding domain-containing protein n=1 Tax=Consotaella salsifontis TaxID=1365950 RepID=A0A1T4LGW4_9HYPH|nr:4Fe-4S dicluster domain-containing protein [Consotaella salsifontis]SJZ53684.1 4Fe-4S binding domain-containing protein [Consotaella salsifontis]
MAYKIDNETCTSCGDCEENCPNGAISHKGTVYKINPAKCTECEGEHDEPQCGEICPSGSCIPAAA